MRTTTVLIGALLLGTAVLVLTFSAGLSGSMSGAVVVGSKNFAESYILGEVMAQLLEDRGFRVERRFGLGGTLMTFEALRVGDLDVYVEYSGTIAQAILKLPQSTSDAELQETLRQRFAMDLLGPLGFNNTYALTLSRSEARRRGLRKISDLVHHPDLRYGFSHDFLNRHDGWPGLARAYGLTAQPVGMEHGLAYPAVHEGKVDVTDAYSTDGDLEQFDLVLLEDDRHYFPGYIAAPLARGSLDAQVRAVLDKLTGTLTDAAMQALNAQASIQKMPFAEVARGFLLEKGLLLADADTGEAGGAGPPSKWAALGWRVVRHLQLTLVALLAGMVVAIPLGVLVYRFRRVARPVIYLAGTLQTIPSLALLAFMIPIFGGIGARPAIAALFLYALLPILRNTALALFTIDPILKKVSVGMGLTFPQRLWHIELPLAAPTILAGIKTAAVINIGTATLAAYIGAGGLGDPIVTGLALYDRSLILEGAIPAALLAILTEVGFEGLEKWVTPKHLLQKPLE
jgi:osmoprotectant transport system permease protein